MQGPFTEGHGAGGHQDRCPRRRARQLRSTQVTTKVVHAAGFPGNAEAAGVLEAGAASDGQGVLELLAQERQDIVDALLAAAGETPTRWGGRSVRRVPRGRVPEGCPYPSGLHCRGGPHRCRGPRPPRPPARRCSPGRSISAKTGGVKPMKSTRPRGGAPKDGAPPRGLGRGASLPRDGLKLYVPLSFGYSSMPRTWRQPPDGGLIALALTASPPTAQTKLQALAGQYRREQIPRPSGLGTGTPMSTSPVRARARRWPDAPRPSTIPACPAG